MSEKYWLFLFIIIALTLRLYNLDQCGLWYDEAISYKAAQLDVISILTNQIQSHAPLYYLTLHYWISVFPDSDFSARMLSVLWNVALIPVVYYLAKELFKENKIALISSLFIVISPFHIAYSQELRMYTQAMFLTTSGILIYLYSVKYDKLTLWSIFTLFFTLSIYTHYFSALVLIAIFLYEIIFRTNKTILFRLSISFSLIFITCLPWMYISLNHPGFSEGNLRPLLDGSTENISIVLPIFNIAILLFGLIYFKINYIIFGIYIIILYFGTLILHKNIINKRHNNSFNLLFLILFTTTTIPSLLYYIFGMYFPSRSLFSASPIILILFSLGIYYRNTLLLCLTIIFLLISFFSTIYYFNNYYRINYWKVPNIKVAELIMNNYHCDDNILHTDDFSFFPLLRYVDFPNHARLYDNDARLLRHVSSYNLVGGELWNLDNLKSRSGRLWLIVAAIKSSDWQAEQKDYIINNYNLIEEFYISGYKVYLLDLDGP